MTNNETITIVTSSLTTSGSIILRQAFEEAHRTVDIIVLGNGREVVNRIDAAGTVIFRVSPKTFIVYRDFVLPYLQNIHHKKLLARILDAFDKSIQLQKLHEGQIPMPATRIIHDVSALADWVPCVLKQPAGNQGDGVFLVHEASEMVELAQRLIDTAGSCIQQEYIHMRPASDKRLFVVGDKVVAAMRRTAKGDDFRSNLHQGGAADPYVPLPEESEVAVSAATCLKLPFCGVDIIDGSTGPLVLEVNPSPGFAVAEISGISVPDMIAHYYVNGD